MTRCRRWLPRRPSPPGPRAALAILVAAVACSGPAEQGGPAPAERIELRPDLVLGVVEGPEEESFGRITGLLGGEDGRIYVLDGQAEAVRVFGPHGALLFSFGRSGEGPGELSAPCCLGWGPDGLLWVREGGNVRFSAFRIGPSSAEFVRSIHAAHLAANLWAETTFSRAGSLIDLDARSAGTPPRTQRVRMFLAGSGMDSVETIDTPPPEALGQIAVDRELPGGGSARLFFYPPFGPRYLQANGPGGVWAEAVSAEYAVTIHDGADTVGIRRPTEPGPELSPEEREEAEGRLASDVRRSGRSSLPLKVPDRKPPLRGLYFDATGRLWVELNAPEGAPHRAHLYDSTGEPVAEATWPGDLELGFPAWAGNGMWCLALATDSLGVQRVVRLTGR